MRYDPLLVHYLARELHERLAGVSARAIRLTATTRTAALETDAGTVSFDLHPARRWITVGAPPPADQVIALHRRTIVGAVSAPPDERLLALELVGAPASRARWLLVELLTNQWNALVLDGTGGDSIGASGGLHGRPAADSGNRGREGTAGRGEAADGEPAKSGGVPAAWGGGRILAVLWARDAGSRRLRPGARYRPPPPSARDGVAAPVEPLAFVRLLEGLPPADRARTLVRTIAWTSPVNALAILGGEANAVALTDAYERYRALASRPPAQPCVLALEPPQPYPLPLPDVPATPSPTLLHAIAAAAGAAPPADAQPRGAGTAVVQPELLERLRRRADALATRARRLAEQGTGAMQEAVALRGKGDILLANLHAVRKGSTAATLPDFAGGEVDIELDPSLSPSANASRLYEVARRREHAAERVPRLIAAADGERERILRAIAALEAGTLAPGALDGLLPATAGRPEAEQERLPYRRYRSSGGLELRVGRSRRDNDELTFRRSSPNDIWLHARDVGGAHVVLRWTDATANPPHRDLVEAAVLAALYSKARTSGTVAVDWTRRKYVRKPRKAPPGLVVPERVKTLFVEPDPTLERRLRAASGEGAGGG